LDRTLRVCGSKITCRSLTKWLWLYSDVRLVPTGYSTLVMFCRQQTSRHICPEFPYSIVDVKPHRLNKETLDKYVVRFADGKTLLVWSIQLEPSERQNTAITIS